MSGGPLVYLLAAVLGILAVVGLVAFIAAPQPETLKASEGSWPFTVSGCWAFCSQYRLNYSFPSPLNTSSVGIYNVTFSAQSLQGTTSAVQLRRINVTVSDGQGPGLYFKSFTPDVVLQNGQTWGPVSSNFTFTNEQLGIAPGQTTSVRVRISVEFDEILGIFGTHYSKTESISDIGVQLRNPNPAPLGSSSAAFPLSWSMIMPIFLVGSLAWAVSGVARKVNSIPRPSSYGWRDPGTGRFVSSTAAFVALLSVVGGIILWVLGVFGTSTHALAYGNMLLGEFTGNIAISAPLSIALFVVGALTHLRN